MTKPDFIPKILVSLLLVLVSPLPVAFAAEYECTIASVLELNDIGQYVSHGWVANYMNRKFFVDRETGKVTGTTALKARLVNFNKTYNPQILNHGGNDDSFKSITIFEDTGEFTVLRINENTSGDKKPYYYQTAIGMLLTGTCTGSRS